MITLCAYPELFGVADNNPYGLKIFAFLKLCKLPFRHEHVLDPKDAPRVQLPYIVDDDAHVGDSDAIVAHLIKKYGLKIDGGLTPAQRDTHLMIRRVLDDLYWVMSYSRWSDERFWPLFRDAFLKFHPAVSPDVLEAARTYNFQRYYYQGLAATSPAPSMKEVSRTSKRLRTSSRTAAISSDQSPQALTWPYTDLSPISTSTRSTRR